MGPQCFSSRQLTAPKVPQDDALIFPARRQRFSAGTVSHDRAAISMEGFTFEIAAGHIPKQDRIVRICRGQRVAIRTETDHRPGSAVRLVLSRNTCNCRNRYQGFANRCSADCNAGASLPSAAWLYEMNALYAIC